jgi:hypothetical protein
MRLALTCTGRDEKMNLQAAMNAFQSWLHVERTAVLYECREAEERLHLGRHGIQERSCENVHALNVRKPKLMSV